MHKPWHVRPAGDLVSQSKWNVGRPFGDQPDGSHRIDRPWPQPHSQSSESSVVFIHSLNSWMSSLPPSLPLPFWSVQIVSDAHLQIVVRFYLYSREMPCSPPQKTKRWNIITWSLAFLKMRHGLIFTPNSYDNPCFQTVAFTQTWDLLTFSLWGNQYTPRYLTPNLIQFNFSPPLLDFF